MQMALNVKAHLAVNVISIAQCVFTMPAQSLVQCMGSQWSTAAAPHSQSFQACFC